MKWKSVLDVWEDFLFVSFSLNNLSLDRWSPETFCELHQSDCFKSDVQVCSWPHLSIDVAQHSQQVGGGVWWAAGSLNALQQLLQRRLQLLLLRLCFTRHTLLMKDPQSLQSFYEHSQNTHSRFLISNFTVLKTKLLFLEIYLEIIHLLNTHFLVVYL